VDYGREKLSRKHLDAVVVNDISRAGIGFDAPENEVTIVLADGERPVPRGPKAEVARAVLAVVSERRAASRARA
jgi:phosphopantothenoylcysteine decarboxylase/phosphopantothenate--cysteine ligase